jgi:hypothetical protein
VLIRFDARGECPVIVREGGPLPDGPGVRWRFVAQAASDLEACKIVLRLQPDRLDRQITPVRTSPSPDAP